MPNSLRLVPALIFIAAFLTACAGVDTGDGAKDANGKPVEYVYYTPTGSNVPVRVRKDETTTSADDTQAAQKAVSDFQRNSAGDQATATGGR